MFKFLIVLVVVTLAAGFRMQMKNDMSLMKKIMTGGLAGIIAFNGMTATTQALTKDEVNSLSYSQVKGTGLANRCPEVTGDGKGSIDLAGKKIKVTGLCVEPSSWQVAEEKDNKKGEVTKEFTKTKLMTRQTYTLADISGTFKDGTFYEEDGIDYAATTVQTPGGERVPFLFSIKKLVAKPSAGTVLKDGFTFGGPTYVPSYRVGTFLDPKGRGITSGYDFSGGLAARQTGAGDSKLFNEENKKFDSLTGDMELKVTKVNTELGEFSGVFVSNQPSDTDMGANKPKDVLIKGTFYGNFE